MARVIAVLAFGLIGAAILVALCNWQLNRLDWKLGVIAQLEERLNAEPVALPADPDPVADKYLRVRVEGRFLPGEAHNLSSMKPWGPGFRIIAPFETAEGRRILVDRGYVPQDQKDAARALPAGTVTGALLWPDEITSATPEPDLEANYWFGRDPWKLADALGTEPVMIVAEEGAGDFPRASPVTVNLKNDHLGYAVTWGGLAAVWLVMTGVVLWRLHKKGGI
ncbi:SURF1 family protein [Rhodovulum sp. DZ06]|uniref:SURF1 family protein n=1 Tax=Rhodovulum sp. DZ06 TaxID=3425126 RepID=UPI003D327D42